MLMEIADGISKEYDYGAILNKLVVEGASAMGGNEFVVSANKRDMNYLRKNLKKIDGALKNATLRLDEKPSDILSGVVVKNPSGNKIYYNTLEGRLEKVKGVMEAKIAERLGVI